MSKTITSEKRHLAELSEAERAEAMQRYRLIQPYLDGEMPLPQLLRSQPNSPSLATARRWIKAYREAGWWVWYGKSVRIGVYIAYLINSEKSLKLWFCSLNI